MLGRHFEKRAAKREITAEPLIDNDPERILVTGTMRMRLDLFGSHIGDRACHLLSALVERTMDHHCQAKVAEQYLILSPQQHIAWLHIAVDEPSVVCILESLGHLLDIG